MKIEFDESINGYLVVLSEDKLRVEYTIGAWLNMEDENGGTAQALNSLNTAKGSLNCLSYMINSAIDKYNAETNNGVKRITPDFVMKELGLENDFNKLVEMMARVRNTVLRDSENEKSNVKKK